MSATKKRSAHSPSPCSGAAAVAVAGAVTAATPGGAPCSGCGAAASVPRLPAAAVDEAGAAGIGEAGEETRCRWMSCKSMNGAAYAAATVAYGSGEAVSRAPAYGAGHAAAWDDFLVEKGLKKRK